MSKPNLDIVLPLYNPKSGWAEDIVRQYEQISLRLEEKCHTRLIVVDDGSTQDNSLGMKHLKESLGAAITLVNYDTNRGKGFALRQGVAESEADIIIYTDHDIPYTYGSMESLVNLILSDEQVQVVIGHRDENYYKDLPWHRVKVSHYLKTINRFILGLNTDDTQCGLKAFRQSIKPIFLETNTDRFMIDIEFLRRLKRRKIRVYVLDVQSRAGVVMSTLGFRTILSELVSYTKIFLTT